jgi:hypothetical protein
LLCVGDDWQSIYGWRGSSPKLFHGVQQGILVAGTTRVMLSDNYAATSTSSTPPSTSFVPRRDSRQEGQGQRRAQGLCRSRCWSAMMRRWGGVAGALPKGDSILMLYRKSSDKSLIEEHIQSVVNVDSSLPPKREA